MAARRTREPRNGRSVHRMVMDLVAAKPKPHQHRQVASDLRMDESRLRMWLSERDRCFRLEVSKWLAEHLDVPLEAVLCKHEPVELVCRRLEALLKRRKRRERGKARPSSAEKKAA